MTHLQHINSAMSGYKIYFFILFLVYLPNLMKLFNTITGLVVFLCVSFINTLVYGQDGVVHANNPMTSGPRNYTSFTAPYVNTGNEALQANAGYEHHPETGKLFAGTPCDNCYELIGKRTKYSKTFVKEGTGGKSIAQQTSNAPMHYKDANGNWLTVKSQLHPDKIWRGFYSADEQEVPASINTISRYAVLGKTGQSFQFDNNLELVFEQADGRQLSLGNAIWTKYTSGDDGVYITDAWPGIDIEMFVIRGSVKTNFWIKRAMPAYSTGKLLVRDHLQMDNGLSLALPDGQVARNDGSYTGNLEIHNNGGEKIFTMSAATAFEKGAVKNTLRMLAYCINGNTLDIALPGDFLDRPSTSYPVIIDPLVSVATLSAVNGTTYSAGWTTGCTYTNPATVPAKVTITDIQFSFQYVTSGGAVLNNGAFDFKLGTCRSPTPLALYWNCNSLLTGSCTGTGASIFSSLFPCAPPPSCSSFDLNVTMDFYQDYLSDPPCSNLYITAGTPLTITVFGTTIDGVAISATSTSICAGQSATLTTSAAHGVGPYSYVWTPGGMTGASVTVSPLTTTTYTVTATDACGDVSTATKTVVVNANAPITGTASICVGSTATLSDAITGGTWSSGNTSVATVGAGSGIVTGIASGTAIITYTNPGGCTSTITATVLPTVLAISGPSSVCQGNTITLSDATGGGTWTSANTAIATIGLTTGVVSGLAPGASVIKYTSPGGCTVTTTITVSPVAPITGTPGVCPGGTTALHNSVGGGTWSSGNTVIASVGASSGIVTGVALGTATITYTTGAGCTSTVVVSVSLLSPVSGPSSVCQGSTIALSDPSSGGTWTSGSTATASVGLSSGVVTGVSGGTTTITYFAPGGCYATAVIAVNPIGAITGPTSMCVGNSVTLSDAVTGGTWTSSNTTIADIGLTNGIVNGLSAGTALITYTTGAGCTANITVTVNVVLPISGTTNVCQGSTIVLSDATTGGTWTSNNTAAATIGITSGVVTGIAGGTATITYSVSGCFVTKVITVNPLAPITGVPTVCIGRTTALSDATTGGSWTSANTTVAAVDASTGMVTGLTAGTSTISYTTATGCVATITVTVNALYPITGTLTVCQGSGTILGNLTAGGTWTSGNTAVATIDAVLGIATGIFPGTSLITYTTPGGCFATATLTVNPLTPISGPSSVCQGLTIILSDATPGGTWSSSNTSVAAIDIAGVVTGISPGTSVISYTTPATCIARMTITVNPLSPITGTTAVCQGNFTTLSDLATGGTWSSTNTSVASIGLTSGIVTGLSSGTSAITYTAPGGCTATTIVTVNPLTPITGITTVCQGFTTPLNDATPGGTWSSSNSAVATVSTTGVVTGVANGTSVINYTTPAGCIATVTVTVNPLTPIAGITSICNSSTLSDATPGGTWSSSNTAVATIGVTSGVVAAVSAGTSVITYTTAGGCFTTITVTVNPVAPVTGLPVVCQGSAATLSDAVTGGTWTSSNTSVAIIDPVAGILTGVSGGTSLISYITPAGCLSTVIATVNPLGPIAGTTTICQGSTTTLTDAATGGTWTSTNFSVANIGISSGVVTGLFAGTSTIIYTTPAGCTANTVVTVNPLAPVTGISPVCQGLTITLSDAVTGGTWNSVTTAVATIDISLGVLTGVSSGSSLIQYTTSLGCIATTTVTVNPIGPITGTTTVCQGNSTTLSDVATGGTWTSALSAVATVGITSGVVSGISSGTTDITYTTAAGCIAAVVVTVNPLAPITGNTSVCAGNTTTLSDAITGGTWTSMNTSVATIDLLSGIATGVTAGAASIQYTTSLGCVASMTLTINAFPSAIAGNTSVCVGNTTTLSNTLTGGTWTSSNTVAATIGLTTGLVTGLSANTTTVSYTTTGGCAVFTTVTINPLPSVITGTTSICQGVTFTLSDATPGGSWSSSSTSVATVDPVTGSVTAIAPGVTSMLYTTAAGCRASAMLTVNPLPYPISGTTTVCQGVTSTLSNGLGGGTWSSTVSSVATVGLTTGVLTGITTGTTIISYITPSGCYSVTTARVNPTPSIGSVTTTGPTTCVTNDGTITLTGLNPGETYTVKFTFGLTAVSLSLTADGSGNIVITNLAKGSYAGISVTNALGCTSNTVAGPLVLSQPAAPAAPSAGNNAPVCEGTELRLTATDATPGVTYSWSGPGGFVSGMQNTAISPAALTASGTYTVTATLVGCVSAPATTSVVIHPIPKITTLSPSNTTTCEGSDGAITLDGLTAGISYAVSYDYNGKPVSVTLTANASGDITIGGLSAGTYTTISAGSFTCVSNSMGPVTLYDPLPAPAPKLGANSPICVGDTLKLTSADAVSNVTYEWVGPNGFSSALKDPIRPNMALIDSGTYMLTIRYLNCPSSSSIEVGVYPPVVLSNVTASQTIPYGSSLQLNADGATFYLWSPNDGTLTDPNIHNPVATPMDAIIYTVHGINQWGCMDTAQVAIKLEDVITEFVPNAFSPNGDGHDDIFKVGNTRYDKLIDFSIYNRWGNLIYHNTYDITKGWDGTYNGVPQDIGVYNYRILLGTPGGNVKEFKGDVTLIR
jgi:gliding motility-associated-like protein